MHDYKIREEHPLYLQLIGQHYNLPWVNKGEPGSCNRRIIRTSARDALQVPAGTLMLISLTLWFRTELFHESDKFGIDEVHVSVKPNSAHQDFYKSWARYADYRAEISNLCTDLVMFTNMLRHREIKYLIYSHAPLESLDLTDLKSSLFGQELLNDPAVVNIFDDCLSNRLSEQHYYYDGLAGHLSAQGHEKAAEILINLIDELA